MKVRVLPIKYNVVGLNLVTSLKDIPDEGYDFGSKPRISGHLSGCLLNIQQCKASFAVLV